MKKIWAGLCLGMIAILAQIGHTQALKQVIGFCQAPNGSFIPLLGAALAPSPGTGYIQEMQLMALDSTGLNRFVQCDSSGNLIVSGGSPPTGAAGGDLGGSYPNPGVAKINGAAVPASAPALATNPAGQPVAQTGAQAAAQIAGQQISVNSIINVKTPPYNCTGDGSTNDSACVVSAVAAASAQGGGTVYFPASSGAYRVMDIAVPSNITLQCASGVIIKMPDGFNGDTDYLFTMNAISPINNVHIGKGCIFDGNEANESGGSTDGGAIAVRMYGATNISIDGPIVQNFWTDGIYIDSTSANIDIAATITGSRRNNLSIVGGTNIHLNVIVSGATSACCGSTGLGVDVEPNNPGFLVQGLSGNIVAYSNIGSGVLIQGAQNVQLNVSSYNNGGAGFSVHGFSYAPSSNVNVVLSAFGNTLGDHAQGTYLTNWSIQDGQVTLGDKLNAISYNPANPTYSTDNIIVGPTSHQVIDSLGAYAGAYANTEPTSWTRFCIGTSWNNDGTRFCAGALYAGINDVLTAGFFDQYVAEGTGLVKVAGFTGDGIYHVLNQVVTPAIALGTATVATQPFDLKGTYGELFSDAAWGGYGETGVGVVIYNDSDNFNIIPDGKNGVAGKKLILSYYDGTQFRSALEYANTASGFGILDLMKSGGNVRIGSALTVNGAISNGITTATNSDNRGHITLSGGTGSYTFTQGPGTAGIWTTAPICIIQDDTTLANIATSTKTVTASSITITGSVGTSDVYSYLCQPGN